MARPINIINLDKPVFDKSIDTSDQVTEGTVNKYMTQGERDKLVNVPSDTNNELALKADTSSLANVATSGDYVDLLNKPLTVVLDENDLGNTTPNQAEPPSQSSVKTYVDNTLGNFSSRKIFKTRNTNINTNLNVTTFSETPIIGTIDETNLEFTVSGNGVIVAHTGKLIVRCNFHTYTTIKDINLTIKIAINGVLQKSTFTSNYIKNSQGNREASTNFFDTIDIVSGDRISIYAEREARSGNVFFSELESSWLELEIPLEGIAQGIQGINGVDGYSGFAWETGNGVPSNLSFQDGDLYLDVATGDLYKKEIGVWVLKSNIKGMDGISGNASSTFMLHASERGSLSNNKYEWGYGDESTSSDNTGHIAMYSGNIVALSLSSRGTGSGTTNVELRKNNVSVNASISLGSNVKSGYKVLITPISFVAGDLLHFKTVLAGDAWDCVVSAIMKMDGV